MAWMKDSQEDEKELEWQQYLHSLRDRYQCQKHFCKVPPLTCSIISTVTLYSVSWVRDRRLAGSVMTAIQER